VICWNAHSLGCHSSYQQTNLCELSLPVKDKQSHKKHCDVHYKFESICNVDWPVTIVGDLNCPNVNWHLLKAPIDRIQNVFLDFVCDSGFEQMVGLPTRDDNVLDLVITSHPLLMSQVSVAQPFANSDHNSVHFFG